MANIANQIPWIEKYRPKTLWDVVGNEEIITRLKYFSKYGNVPNIILSGAPGTGKTTSILCLARALLDANFKDAVLELNASDERGIDIIRNDIKMFAHKKMTLPPGRHKIIILDEADSMTEGAQQALRRIIEDFSSTTRFALACNTSDKIIEPIQSRCAVLRFSKLTDEQILTRLLQVCEQEKVFKTNDGLEALLYTAQGDMRYALNNLQSTFITFDMVDADNVYKLCGEPHPVIVKLILESCSNNEIQKSLGYLQEIWNQGYSSVDIISTLSKVVKSMNLSEHLRLEFLKQIGLTHMMIADGNTSLIQLSGLLARLCLISIDDYKKIE